MRKVAASGSTAGEIPALPVHKFDDEMSPDCPHRSREACDEIIRLRVRQIPDEHGDALTETLRAAAGTTEEMKLGGERVNGWLASAGGRLVHHVVVNECEDMQQFESGTR